MATVGYSGFLAGPPLIGFVASMVGLRPALSILILAAILIVGAASRWLMAAHPTGGNPCTISA
jgi:hypothetical protein